MEDSCKQSSPWAQTASAELPSSNTSGRSGFEVSRLQGGDQTQPSGGTTAHQASSTAEELLATAWGF